MTSGFELVQPSYVSMLVAAHVESIGQAFPGFPIAVQMFPHYVRSTKYFRVGSCISIHGFNYLKKDETFEVLNLEPCKFDRLDYTHAYAAQSAVRSSFYEFEGYSTE